MPSSAERGLDPRLPKPIGRYEAFLQIGTGGMARVYLAGRRSLHGDGELVVVKELRREIADDEHVLALFLDEARIAMRLEHPNIVRTREVVAESPDFHLTMDFVDGQSLLSVLRRVGRQAVPVEEHLFILSEVLAGLAHAHELRGEGGVPLGIVHRDVSPSNVLVGYRGEVKLLDFGIAKATGALAATHEGAVKGKLGYAAPEQCLGKPADPRSDLYAVGVMLWEAVAGRRRSSGETWHSILQARLEDAEPDLAQVRPRAAPALLALTRRALSREPENRYSTARELKRDLDAYLASLPRRVGRDQVAKLLEGHFAADRTDASHAIEAYFGRGPKRTASGSRPRVQAPPPPAPRAPALVPPPALDAARTGDTEPFDLPDDLVADAWSEPDENTSPIPVDDALLMMTRSHSAPPKARSTPHTPLPRQTALPADLVAQPEGAPATPAAHAGFAAPPTGAPVSSADPAALSSRRFSATAITETGTGAESRISGAAPIDSPDPDFAPRRGPVWLWALLGGATAAAAIGVLYARGTLAPAAPAATAASAREATVAAATAAASAAATKGAERVKVRISARPSSAQIRLDGRLLDGNPFVGELPTDAAEHELRARADGFREQKRTLRLDADTDIELVLEPRLLGRAPPPPSRGAAPSNTPQSESRPTPGRVEPGMDLEARPPSTRLKRNIDEKDPYAP